MAVAARSGPGKCGSADNEPHRFRLTRPGSVVDVYIYANVDNHLDDVNAYANVLCIHNK